MRRTHGKRTKAERSISPVQRRSRRRAEARGSDAAAEVKDEEELQQRGFAHLRGEGGINASLQRQQPQQKHQQWTAVTPSPVSIPTSAPLADGDAVFASPRTSRSVTRGFSHLRDSISFVLPQIRGDVRAASSSPRGSIILPVSTPPPVPASRGSLSSSHSERDNRAQQQQQQQQQQYYLPPQRLPPHRHHRNGSNQSFLSTRSAIEYLNSTGSLGEIISSRGSLRSSQATASHNSVSHSTLGPLELSPILKEEKRQRRRRGGGGGGEGNRSGGGDGGPSTRRPLLKGLPIEVPAALANSVAAEEQQSRRETLEELHRSLARCSRGATIVALTLFFIAMWGVLAAPLMLRLEGPEDVLVRHYVDTVSELQFIYGVPHMSLNSNETRRLYLRLLSETLERFERATSHLKPGVDFNAQVLYYKRMIKAYQTIRHRAQLYARSRNRSRVRQYVLDPLRDAWHYGLLRHGVAPTLRDVFWEPSLSRMWARMKDSVVCLRQDEKMPCPTLAYLQERQQEEEEEGIETTPVDMDDTVQGQRHLHMREVWRLQRLLEYVKRSYRQSSREYNHLFSGDDTGAVIS
ncbi:hypothetical protein DQ04_01451010 [Trypanosoma grayi]|uniref:hypothetical protein n=1 Tax=Trypanosoma grayi TaxID=71804 RepID=UPI0004F461B7|nr:hypothetical protein DQ04_01451010 [Trypanosoma grayi]KEG12742.1 hypothetical protein DQ04_01451010 [Trypanosoma grayi]